MDTLNYFIKSAPLPVILHDGLSTIEASDEFKKLTSCQNTQKIDLGQCLLNSFKAGKTLDVLIEGLKQKKELHLDISVYKKGSKTNWKVRSFPFAYAEGDGPCLQITWFIDDSYQSMRNAYWDLQVHVNIASAEIIRKGAELNDVNTRLQEINEKLELEISERKKVGEELARLKQQYELILVLRSGRDSGVEFAGSITRSSTRPRQGCWATKPKSLSAVAATAPGTIPNLMEVPTPQKSVRSTPPIGMGWCIARPPMCSGERMVQAFLSSI